MLGSDVSGPTPAPNSALDRLSSVAHLLRADRQHHWWDIVLATVFDALSSGPKTTSEVCAAIRARWPGIQIADRTIEIALDQAKERGLVTRDATLTPAWAVTGPIEAERNASRRIPNHSLNRPKPNSSTACVEKSVASWTMRQRPPGQPSCCPPLNLA